MNTGVATNKNMLGMMLLVISLGTVWYFITLLRAKGRPNRGRQLLAQGTLLVFGIALFLMANSATSSVCFVLGSTIIFATGLRAIKKRRVRVHMLCLGLILAGGFAMILGGSTFVTNMLGRKSNFSGRTEIWAALIPTVPNPLVGAGFESYWISPAVLKFQQRMLAEGWWHPEGLNEAHNGYIEVYLELGCLGVGLIAAILITGYRRAVAAFRLNPSIGGLMLAYVIVAAVYGITEAGFRMMALAWLFLLFAVVGASGIAAGYIKLEPSRVLGSRGGTVSRTPASKELIPETETV
jgi:O-antigen ligase